MIGKIVKITTSNPDGSKEFMLGKIGVVTKCEDVNYTINTGDTEFVYGQEQFRLAKDDEIAMELKKRILGG